MSFIAMIAQLLRTSYAANKLLSPPNASITLFFTSILPLILDIFALSGSVSLFVLSSTTRKEYKSFYLCQPVSHLALISSTPK
uniref:Uncharacterized protein n=1 Tax=Panagrolaimus sp. PS1159 TaxID=55785 RepID=A0AC35GA43_9BILA